MLKQDGKADAAHFEVSAFHFRNPPVAGVASMLWLWILLIVSEPVFESVASPVNEASAAASEVFPIQIFPLGREDVIFELNVVQSVELK